MRQINSAITSDISVNNEYSIIFIGSDGEPDFHNTLLTRAITELEHHDNNIIEKNRYIMSMRKVVFRIKEVSS